MSFENYISSSQKLDLVFGEDAKSLLVNVRSHLEKERLEPISLNITREHNNFCAIIIGKPINVLNENEFIG
jgi:hypothetical protein